MDDVTLQIHIERPSASNPHGHISMSAQTKNPAEEHPRFEDAADGNHDGGTMLRVMQDVLSYFHTGRKCFANKASRGGGTHSR